MDEAWERLQHAASASIDWIWHSFAKDGNETAVLAQVAMSPKAAGWLVGCLAMADDDIARKIGAMLAGLINDAVQGKLLQELLQAERNRFAADPLGANSVTEDIVCSAARWLEHGGECHKAGCDVLGEIVDDALNSISWNTAGCASATLYVAMGSNHPALLRLASAKLDSDSELAVVSELIKREDSQKLREMAVTPSQIESFPADCSDAHLAHELWAAVKDAEIEALKP